MGVFSSKTLVPIYINADLLKLHHMQALLNIQVNCNNIDYWDYLHFYMKQWTRQPEMSDRKSTVVSVQGYSQVPKKLKGVECGL